MSLPITDTTPGAAGAISRRRVAFRNAPSRLSAYAAITLASFASYVLGKALPGEIATAFAVAGVGACGWAWLLTRALFDARPRDALWPRMVAAVIQMTGALAILAPAGGAVEQIGGNLYGLCGSAALLLTFIEPIHRPWVGLPDAERRFRLVFVAAYTLLVAVSILGLRPADGAEAHRIDLIKAICAFGGLWAAAAATGYRLRHPLPVDPTAPTRRRSPAVFDRELGDRLLRLLHTEEVYTDADLRIGDVAGRLQAPEHKVSQCIAGLGFSNFNRLINHHRIARAKVLLADEAEDESILSIAFQSGFASIGPFNRAFKEEVGTTPRAFRATRARASQPT